MGQNNLSSIKIYSATDYMLETILFVYCLLFINTFYLNPNGLDLSTSTPSPKGLSSSPLGAAFLAKSLRGGEGQRGGLNSQNNDTTILKNFKMNIQSAENCKGFSETVRQLPDIEDYKF